jgi:hypothetical protein
MTDPLEIVRRNHLLNYARRRVDDAVIKPMMEENEKLGAAWLTLDRLREHFKGLGIAIGHITIVQNSVLVTVEPA